MAVQFKGVAFFMNGREYIVPSLSLRQLEANYEVLARAGDILSIEGEGGEKKIIEAFKVYVPIIALAVQRNYPEVTEENLWEWLDIGNFAEMLMIVQSAAGFKKVTSGEATPAS